MDRSWIIEYKIRLLIGEDQSNIEYKKWANIQNKITIDTILKGHLLIIIPFEYSLKKNRISIAIK